MNIKDITRNLPKWAFKEKPSLEDYIAAHEPVDTGQVEYLEKQYDRFMYSQNFWGTAF